MSWTLELWVEGPTDASRDLGGEAPAEPEGALVPIVRSVLQRLSGLSSDAFARVLPEGNLRVHFLRERFRAAASLPGAPKRQLSGRVRKALQTFQNLSVLHPQTLFVAFWDCDSEPVNLQDRDEIHRELRGRGERGLAVGVCVQMLEAWLLADAGAFRRCFGRGPAEGFPGRPESIQAPKGPLTALLEEYEARLRFGGTAAAYREIAKHIDLDVLAANCPKGFGRFREDAREFLIPLLAAEPT